MKLTDLSRILDENSDERFVDSQILNRTPWIFKDQKSYDAWRGALAVNARLQPKDFFIVGSAATGFSLNPTKPGRDFQALSVESFERSDLDLALVSEEIFVQAWNIMVRYDRDRILRFQPDTLAKLRTGIYWGHLSDYLIPRNTSPARQIRTVIVTAGQDVTLRGYRTSARIYRRFEDLRSYLVYSLRQLRMTVKQLEEKR